MRMRARGLVVGAFLALSAPMAAHVMPDGPRCLSDSCAQRLLKRAARCFDPEGPCVRDETAGVTCWQNGAHTTTITLPDGSAERSAYVGPGGRRCQTVTSVPDAGGYQQTTHTRKGRKVVFRTSAEGLRVTCPGGRVERYTYADLAAVTCPSVGTPPVTCDPGRCN